MDPTYVDLSVRTGQFISEQSEIPPDITFKFHGSRDEVSAHKMYLAMVSRVFRNMFFVHNTEDKLADVLVMEDTTKRPFQAMIHAIYHFKAMKESLKEMSIDDIFSVVYLVTKYEIPELVLAVEEYLSTIPVSEDNVLEVATCAMDYTSTFGEHAEMLLLSCAKFLKTKLTDAVSPFQALTEFVTKNGNHMAAVHKLAVLMKDLPPFACSGCLRKPTECPKEKEIKTQPTKKFKLASRVKCSRFNDNDTKTLETFERLMNDESSGEESVKIQPTKKFKLASRVKCSRFNDNYTKAQETFERLMNDESSGEESDVFCCGGDENKKINDKTM